MNGAATNPDCHVLAYAAAQVKKGLDIAKKLGAENFGMNALMVFTCHNVKYQHVAPLACIKQCIFVLSVLGWKGRIPLHP